MRFLLELFIELINLPALVRNLFQHRQLIRALTWRDFTARFRGSFGGALWSFIQPLIMMAIYTLVFSYFLKVKFGSSDSPFIFAVFLLCGLLPWNTFSESFSGAATIIRGNTNLVKRVVFPLEILPLNLTLVATIQQLIGLVLLLPLAWLVTGSVHWTLTLLPIILLIQMLFFVGLNWIWASLAVYLPDLRQITGLLLMMLMFLTPLFYPREIVPDWAAGILSINPLTGIIDMYRKAIMTGEIIPLGDLAYTGGISLLFFLVGYFWFMRTKKGFSDVL